MALYVVWLLVCLCELFSEVPVNNVRTRLPTQAVASFFCDCPVSELQCHKEGCASFEVPSRKRSVFVVTLSSFVAPREWVVATTATVQNVLRVLLGTACRCVRNWGANSSASSRSGTRLPTHAAQLNEPSLVPMSNHPHRRTSGAVASLLCLDELRVFHFELSALDQFRVVVALGMTARLPVSLVLRCVCARHTAGQFKRSGSCFQTGVRRCINTQFSASRERKSKKDRKNANCENTEQRVGRSSGRDISLPPLPNDVFGSGQQMRIGSSRVPAKTTNFSLD